MKPFDLSEIIIREAVVRDIPDIQRVRNAVRENRLSDPRLVTDADCLNYLVNRGKGWIAETNEEIVGFAIADLQDNNIWALFLCPAYEGRGVGRILHDKMLDWYFAQRNDAVWLSTARGTRAEGFYRAAGWTEAGMQGAEIRFEMHGADWLKQRAAVTG